MVKEVREARACDTLQRYQANEISIGLRLQSKSDSLLDIREREIKADSVLIGAWQDRYLLEVKAVAQSERKVRKWKLITGFAIGIVVLQTIFAP
jgi:hypothetical protein